MKLKEATKIVECGIEKTLIYCDFLIKHRSRIRTNNVIKRPNRDIHRRIGYLRSNSIYVNKKQIRTHPQKEVRSDLLGMVHHRGLEPRTH